MCVHLTLCILVYVASIHQVFSWSVCDLCSCYDNPYDNDGFIVSCVGERLNLNPFPEIPNKTATLILNNIRLNIDEHSRWNWLHHGHVALEHLDLFNNRISGEAFNHFPSDIKLKMLKVQWNLFDRYPRTIGRLTTLHHLAIDGQNMQIPKEYRNLKHLQILDLSSIRCGIKVITPAMFRHVPHITDLIMHSCPIFKYMPESLLAVRGLNVLDISCNPNLGPHNFASIVKDIEFMNVSTLISQNVGGATNNLMLDFEVMSRMNRSYVTNWYLDENYMSVVYFNRLFRSFDLVSAREVMILNVQSVPDPNRDFKDFVNIFKTKILMYGNGQLERNVCTHKFHRQEVIPQEMSKILGRDVAINQDISNLTLVLLAGHCYRDRILYELGDLSYLQVEATHVDRMIPSDMNGSALCIHAQNLKILKIKDSLLHKVDFRIYGLEQLISIELNNLELRYIAKEAFLSFPRLEHLELLNNNFGNYFYDMQVSYGSTHVPPDLTIIVLRNNNISKWHSEILRKMTKLSILDLSSNKLESFAFNITNVTYLNLSSNLLKDVISGELKRSLETLSQTQYVEVDISNNRFPCCQPTNFKQLMKQSNVHFANVDKMTCSKDGHQHLVINVNIDLMCKHSVMHIIYAILNTVITLLLLGLLYYYRNKAKYKYYIWKYYFKAIFRRKFGRTKEIDNKAVRYFVSYDHSDSAWVKDEMIPHLQNEMKCNLYIHEVDFVLGVPIVENIVYAIDTCDRTIFVLSEHFLESKWCQFELNIALTKGLDCTLPIILSTLPSDKIPRVVKFLLQSNTYIEWPDNTNERDIFWYRVRDALKHPLKDPEKLN